MLDPKVKNHEAIFPSPRCHSLCCVTQPGTYLINEINDALQHAPQAWELGIVPGQEITVISTGAVFQIKIGTSKMGIDRKILEPVIVQWLGT